MRNFKNKRFGGLPSRLFFVAVAFAADRFSSSYARRRNRIYTTDLPKRRLGDNAAYTPPFGINGLKRLPTRPDGAGESAALPRSVFGTARYGKAF